jgi:iron complex outermembrane recepter protein
MAKLLRAVIALGCAYAASNSEAVAQTARSERSERDIVVTAQFREQKLQDTPLSITAVSAALLQSRGQTSIGDVANQAPNVTLKQTSGSFGPSMAASIRGIGQHDFNPALEPGVGIYIDDVYLPTLTGAMLDLLDLQRVEVLRGPQGTLTGRNSIGGAIRLITQKPTGETGGFAEASAGSADLLSFRGAINFAITDNLAARISGVVKSQDGYVDRIDYGCANPGGGIPALSPAGDCNVETMGDYTYDAIRGALRFTPNDRLTLDVNANYVKDERSAAEVLSFAGNAGPNVRINGVPFDYCNYGTFANPAATTWVDFTGLLTGTPGAVIPLAQITTSGATKQVFEGHGFSANIDYALTDALNVVSISAYRQYESSFNSDDDLSPLPVSLGQNALKHDFFSQELRLNGVLGDKINFTLGAYYSDQSTTYYTFQDLRYAPFPLQFIGDDPVQADSKAAFATIIWKPLEPLTVTGGLRYTEESKDYTFVRVIRRMDRSTFSSIRPARSTAPPPLIKATKRITGSAWTIAGRHIC